jgi:hypothetical protein
MEKEETQTRTCQLALDLLTCNTYDLKYVIDNDDAFITVDLPNANIYIHRRPNYCDRGRYGFHVVPKPGKEWFLSIDHTDGFPRYFFKLQRALDEIQDWVEFNKEKLNKELQVDTTEQQLNTKALVQKMSILMPNVLMIAENDVFNVFAFAGRPDRMIEAILRNLARNKILKHVILVSAGIVIGATPQEIDEQLQANEAQL